MIYLLLNITGLFVGDILFSMNVLFNPFFYITAILIGFSGLIIYPSVKLKSRYKNFYFQQKTADIFLIFSTFLFIIYWGNSVNNPNIKAVNGTVANTIIHLSSNVSTQTDREGSTVFKKELRKKVRNIIKEIRKKYKAPTKGEKTLSIVLFILFAAGLIVILGGLSCSISCSGSEALANIVFFTGLAGIIFGLVKVIQRINRGKPQKAVLETAP